MTDTKSSNDKQWTLIERYLRNEMPPDERQAFEARLADDHEFRQEFELHQEVHETLGDPDANAFRKTLAEVGSTWQDKTASNASGLQGRGFVVRLLGIAAAVVVLLGVAFWLFKPVGGDVFSKHFEPYAMVLTERAPDDRSSESILLADAIKRYEQQQYIEAAASFETLAELRPLAVSYHFYAGVSYLGAGDANNAIRVFSSLVSMSDHLLMEQANWYLALAYIKGGDLEKGKNTLEAIGPDEYNYDEARKLLKKIE